MTTRADHMRSHGLAEPATPGHDAHGSLRALRVAVPGPRPRDPIPGLARVLLEAATFESAAPQVLQAMQEVVRQEAEDGGAASPFGLVHLRPEAGGRGLIVAGEAGERGATRADLALSQALWQRLEAHRCAIAIDVQARTARLDAGATPEPFDEVAALADRGVASLHVLPMRSRGGVHGLFGVALPWQDAATPARQWQAAGRLQLVADIATPTLRMLPHAHVPGACSDPLLPVVGAAMQPLVDLLDGFARLDETLLIMGPTGAGKSRMAAWCHARSGRGGGFQTVDLLSVPEDMQMAELFGWKRGSFTGAVQDRVGCVALSEGGTLFIDEIDKLSMKAQAGLLTLLETRQYRVLGDPGQARAADVRFVVGTNTDLAAAVARGRFREDLYYRINVLPVRLPPLAERGDEIEAWARFMLERRHQHAGARSAAHLSAEAALVLARKPWPGNLRQLDNIIRRAYAVALADRGHPAEDLWIGLRHVEHALSLDTTDTSPSLMHCLRRAAGEFFAEARRRAARGQSLDLQHATAFPGLVIEAGMQELGDLKQTYEVLGHEHLVKSRNHQREYRREREKVERLAESLDEHLDGRG